MAIYSGSPHQTLEDLHKPPAPRVLCAFLRPTRFPRVWPTGIFWVKQPLRPVFETKEEDVRSSVNCGGPFLLVSKEDDQSISKFHKLQMLCFLFWLAR